MNAQKYLEIPVDVVQTGWTIPGVQARTAAFVSVELADGRQFKNLLLLHPNHIIGMKGESVLPFNPLFITRAFQTSEDLELRSSSDWAFWPHP